MPSKGWLLDTNVLSELRKGAGRRDASVWAWVAGLPKERTLLCDVTVAEIRRGIETATDPGFRVRLQAWLREEVRPAFAGRIMPADEDVLLLWRHLNIAGQRSRYTYSQPDSLIAATALRHGLGVATRNVADFERAGVPVLNPWTVPAG